VTGLGRCNAQLEVITTVQYRTSLSGPRRTSARRSISARIMARAVWVVTLTLAIGVGAARAQFPGDQVPVRPVRVTGSWGKTTADPNVIGEVTISADGSDRRTFGVTAIQAYNPVEEGMQIVRHSSLQPVTFLLRGRKELIEKLNAAKPDQPVTIFGVYNAGNANLVLSSVDVAG
jgi:hypothetical protein